MKRAALWRLLVFAGLLSFACGPKHGASIPTGKLPAGVEPTHYRLDFEIDPRKSTFSGTAHIDVKIQHPTSTIWLHGNGLAVSRVQLRFPNGQPVGGIYEQVKEGGVARITLERVVAPGRAVLEMRWTARFNQELEGLYHVEEAGEHYAFTQLEAVDARRMFPGFDEPRFKTPFDVSIIAYKDDTVAANTRAISQTMLPGDRKKVQFATTLPIPTYLIATAVGPLDVVDGPMIGDTRLRGLAAKGKGDQLAFALAETPAVLKLLEEYFGMPYPYDKLDVVAAPDFAYGAMENVGLVIFREWLLLLDDETAGAEQRQDLVRVMAHELAHMWFGNLVTTEWWNDIWLNEAFATWMAARVTHTYRPDWQVDTEFLAGVHGAMGADSLDSARKIRQPILSQHDIVDAFDGITYSKGGGVLAMFERWVGPDVFRRGLQRYMTQHAHQSASLEDLTAALSAEAGRDLATPLKSFVNQSGIPFVDVTVSCEDSQTPRLELAQSRYLPIGSKASAKRVWQVPVCVKYSVNGKVHQACTLLTKPTGELALDEANGCPEWVFPNAGATGYYRWALSSEWLGRLRDKGAAHLSDGELLAMADSVGSGFRSGKLPAADVISLMLPLAAHENRFVARAPMGILAFSRNELSAEYRVRVEQVSVNTYGPVWELMNKPGAKADAQLRASVASFLAFTARDKNVRAEMATLGRRYVGWGADNAVHADAVDQDLCATALAVAAQQGDDAFLMHLVTLLKNEKDSTVRSNLLHAIAKVTDPALATKVRNLTGAPGLLRTNEKGTLIQMHLDEPDNRQPTWDWFRENAEMIRKSLPTSHLSRLPRIASGFGTEAKAKEVEAFFEPFIHDVPGGPRALASTVERIRLKAALLEAQRASAEQYFQEKR